MKDIIVYLTCIYGVAKDLHYTSKGICFYSLHLMFDNISDDILDYIDEIKENYYLANDYEVPTAKEINTQSLEFLSGSSTIEELKNLITLCIYHIEEYIRINENLNEGDKSLLGDISNNLNKKLGFVNQTIKNSGE